MLPKHIPRGGLSFWAEGQRAEGRKTRGGEKNKVAQLDDSTPVAYQRGFIEFYKLKFSLTQDVLIPRPETELLVDEVLTFAKENPGPLTILDIGTGAGAIAISVAKNLPGHRIIATEVSPKALAIAQKNAKLHGVDIEFVVSDLLEADLPEPDIIVTNLPYIPSERIAYLDASVKDFEPHVALDGGQDGFELYRKLFQQINDKGWKPKLILGEIDYTHGEIAQNEANQFFPKAQTEVKLDLYHRQRILKIDQSS